MPLRPELKSNLNLAFNKGRIIKPKNERPYYKPRPYYEVEITLWVSHLVPPLTNFIPNTNSKPIELFAFTDNEMYFPCKFKRKTSKKNDKRSLYETGADFMSTPRIELGKFIKNKLIESGSMNYGDQITSDTLAYYGKDFIDVRMLNKTTIHLEF